MNYDLVKRLREKAGAFDYDGRPDIACDYEQAADAIEQLTNAGSAYGRGWTLGYDAGREESKPRWIPVTERLPEEHVFVLIRQDDDRIMIAERVDGDWWYRYFAYDVNRWDENEQGAITHWMPLPEPPEEE